MDPIDEKILKLLKKNARMTYVEIGEQIGLSEGAVRNRVQSLLNNGRVSRDVNGKTEDFLYVTYGENDCPGKLCILKEEDVLRSLHFVGLA